MQAGQFVLAVVLTGTATTAALAREAQPGVRQRQAEFREMDRNGDGVITRAEWRGSMQAFRRYDVNRDGELSGNEIWSDRTDGRTFADFDRNGNGVITRGEWIGGADEFRALDADNDDVITRSEFRGRREGTESPAYRAGRERGLSDGRQAGREDKTINGGRWDLEGQRELETADAGYTPSLGDRADYQAGYRAGFRLGYREGFGPR